MADNRVGRLPGRCIERVDDVRLNLSDRSGQLEVFRDLFALAPGRPRGVRVGGRYRQRAAKQNGRASVVHQNNRPQTDAQLTFLLCEDDGIGVLVRWDNVGVVMKPKLDSQPDQAADKTPECPSLSLFECQLDSLYP